VIPGIERTLGICHGLIQANGTDPAANTEIRETVAAGETWLLLSLSVLLVQGATQTPQPILVIDDGTDVVWEGFGCTTAQAVSTTCRYTWGVGLPLTDKVGATTNVHATAPLPSGLILPSGYRIRTSTIGLGANSDFGAPSLLYVKYGG
jgi:hypothetical protein